MTIEDGGALRADAGELSDDAGDGDDDRLDSDLIAALHPAGSPIEAGDRDDPLAAWPAREMAERAAGRHLSAGDRAWIAKQNADAVEDSAPDCGYMCNHVRGVSLEHYKGVASVDRPPMTAVRLTAPPMMTRRPGLERKH